MKQGLAAGSCGLQATRRCTRVKHAEKLNRHASCSTTGQKIQTGHSVSSRLGFATQSSCETKSLVHSVMEKKLTLRIPFSLNSKGHATQQKNSTKVLVNEPLKDVTMERVRIEEFEESLCKDYR